MTPQYKSLNLTVVVEEDKRGVAGSCGFRGLIMWIQPEVSTCRNKIPYLPTLSVNHLQQSFDRRHGMSIIIADTKYMMMVIRSGVLLLCPLTTCVTASNFRTDQPSEIHM